MSNVGHNSAPGQREIAREVFDELSLWLDGNPVIQTHEQAKHAAQLIKRGKIALDELDEERDGKVRPLNDTVRDVNGQYKIVSEPLSKVVGLVKANLKDHLEAEEARRLAEAEARYNEAQAEVEALRAAQEAEREAIENASAGEVGANIGAVIAQTAKAAAAVDRATRAAQIAEKDSIVRVSPGFGRPLSLRNVEVLIVEDAVEAVKDMSDYPSLTDGLNAAIITAAKFYRKLKGELPAGVRAETERKL